MSRLHEKISSQYISAMNRLEGRKAPQRVVAYVESYDDVRFWSNLLRPLETDKVRFEVMLPSNVSLGKGKKVALANNLGKRLGSCLIACVDADYDYLMQGATPTSHEVCHNPYVFHTYAYAIENYHCYAPTLHNVCVAATLTDRQVFDFEKFLKLYSAVVFPLFVWNVWAYRYGRYTAFSMSDLLKVIAPVEVNLVHPERTLDALRRKVNRSIARLQQLFPEGRRTYAPLREQMEQLGVTPETTYLYLRGHDLEESIIGPYVGKACEMLRRAQERDIRDLARHETQLRNELAGYQRSIQPFEQALRHQMGYVECPLYQRIQKDVQARIVEPLSASHTQGK